MANKKNRGGRQSDQGDRNLSGNARQRPEKQGVKKGIDERDSGRERRGNDSPNDGRHGGNR